MQSIYNRPSSLKSARFISSKLHTSPQNTQNFISSQESHQLFKRTQIRENSRNIAPVPNGPNAVWQVDLMDMSNWARWNKGYHFILIASDTFSKMIRVVPMHRKTKEDSLAAFRLLFKYVAPSSSFRTAALSSPIIWQRIWPRIFTYAGPSQKSVRMRLRSRVIFGMLQDCLPKELA